MEPNWQGKPTGIAKVEGKSPPAAALVPSLSIFHLMLWTFCSALYMALMRVILSMNTTPEQYVALQQTWSVYHGVINGAVLAGGIVLLVWRLKAGPPLARQPGHWLLLVPAGLTVVHLPIYALFALSSVDGIFSSLASWFQAFISLVGAAAYAIAVWKSSQLRWKLVFGVLAGWLALQSAVQIFWVLYWALHWTSILIRLWVVVLIVIEWTRGERRDWLHWLGVATYIAQGGGILIWTVWSMFIR